MKNLQIEVKLDLSEAQIRSGWSTSVYMTRRAVLRLKSNTGAVAIGFRNLFNYLIDFGVRIRHCEKS